MNSITVTTRYPEIVKACQAQKVSIKTAFAKIESIPDGVRASYPMVKLAHGVIPMRYGKVVFNHNRMVSATRLANMHHESGIVKKTISNVMKGLITNRNAAFASDNIIEEIL